ncbi:hypothetical protein [Halarchaeum salinum]|uniref:hypothetical protein n=1 Tax=Halarchaeum salinum TaxID=489912 RepID=UPI001B877423
MATHTPSRTRSRRVATHVGAVVAFLTAVVVWQRAVRVVTRAAVASLPFDGLVFSGFLSAAVFLVGLALLAVGWARYRGVDLGVKWPARAHWPLIVVAGSGAVALIAATAVLGALTAVPYGALAKVQYGTLDPIAPVLAVAGLGVLVSVPGLALVCQVLVQTPLRAVFGGERAVIATTVLTSVAFVSDTGGLAAVPSIGRLFGVALLAALVGLGVVVNARDVDGWRRLFVLGGLLLVGIAIVGSALLGVDSIAGVAYALARVGVLALAALVYERSASLLASILVYLAFALTNVLVLLTTAGGPAPF